MLRFYFFDSEILIFDIFQLHVHVKRHLMNDLPETDDAIAQWCKDAFVAKVMHTFLLIINFQLSPTEYTLLKNKGLLKPAK